jgi:hypothetical protein
MTAEELAQKIEAAKGDNHKINTAKQDFVDQGGTKSAQQGGKVFSDTDGGKVFVTDGGKVFNNRP